MGCDIHGWIRNKSNDTMIAELDNVDMGWRNYNLFSALSDVRSHVDNIVSLRDSGLAQTEMPDTKLMHVDRWDVEDSAVIDGTTGQVCQDIAESEPIVDYMDCADIHTITVFTLRDLLDYQMDYFLKFNYTKSGIISREQYGEWSGGRPDGRPDGWSAAIGGGNIVVIDERDLGNTQALVPHRSNWTHITVRWQENIGEQIQGWIDKAVKVCDGVDPSDAQFMIGYDN